MEVSLVKGAENVYKTGPPLKFVEGTLKASDCVVEFPKPEKLDSNTSLDKSIWVIINPMA